MHAEPAVIANATLTVDLDALTANYRSLAELCAPARLGAVVKADGYGLGAVPVSTALAAVGCRHFFVAQLSEAVLLGPSLPGDAALYILNGLHAGGEAACAAIGAIPVLNSLDQIARWSAEATAKDRRLPAVLQVDSGMARLGLPPGEVAILGAEPERLASVDLTLVMSHLACADHPDAPSNGAQLDAFTGLADLFPGVPRSLDNSAGILLPRGHFDVARAGIALYGGAPLIGVPAATRAVVSLEAPIVQLREIEAGVGVGYGLTSVADHPRTIATIAVGYADGWPRSLGNKGSAFVAGVRVPIVGRVSMDSITLDATGLPRSAVAPGALVELLGPHQGIDDVAADAGTIAYEILTRLGHRFARSYVGGA